ncbi:GNAT domain-containing protein [Aspergillus ambiguus]|uniref:GNAT family N-acetyltransferase n=1 Tax=Aspergillus ambiguus TaxID=176160 RepID=UPI003CCD5DC4
MAAATAADDFVTLKAPLPIIPLPPNSERPIITTNRLLIRPLQPTDLDALHVLRTQPEVMKWTSTGRIDQTLDETSQKLALFLPPNDATTFNCAICARHSDELLGVGGCHLYPGQHGWPELGYMLRRECWGQGLASEFLGAWLQAWAALPRADCEVTVQRGMKAEGAAGREHLIAVTEATNVPSQKVLLRSGFRRLCEFTEIDGDGGEGEGKGVVQLVAFCYFPSG